MSRMATMQVLNDAFKTANAAFDAYTRNKNEERRMELANKMAILDREYRDQQAAQRQANLDRAYEWGMQRAAQQQANADRMFDYRRALDARQAAQRQANWQAAFDRAGEAANAAQKQRDAAMFMNILKAAPDEATANALVRQMGVGFGDPVMQGALLSDYYRQKNAQKASKLYDDYLGYINKLQLAKDKAQRRDLETREKWENAQMRNAIPFIQNSVNNGKSIEQAVQEYQEMAALLKGNYTGPSAPLMTPEQALQAFKEGRMTKVQLAEFRKNYR